MSNNDDSIVIPEAGWYRIGSGFSPDKPVSLYGAEALAPDWVEVVKLDSPDHPDGELIDLRVRE